MKELRITKWNDIFENADTRKRQRLGWLGIPTGCESNGYLALVAEKGGFEAFGIFLAICQWSATQPKGVRGRLIRSNGRPLTEKDIAIRIRAEACQVSAALKLLKNQEIGWIEEAESEKSADDLPPACQSHPDFVQVEVEVEGEVEGEALSPLPPLGAERASEYAEKMPSPAALRMRDLERRIQNLKPDWKTAFTRAEMQLLVENSRAIDSLTDQDWTALGQYLVAKLPQGEPDERPRYRSKLLEWLPDIVARAMEWDRKRKRKRPSRTTTAPATPRRTMTPEEEAEIALILSGKSQ